MQNRLKIILVDDDEDDCFLFQDAIEEMGSQISLATVNTCEELMHMLHLPNRKLPDIIFLDLNMPGQNGKECLEEIRKHQNLKHIPVAIYSTSDSEKDIAETFQKGANLYIQKPREFNKIKKVINEVANMNWARPHNPVRKENYYWNP